MKYKNWIIEDVDIDMLKALSKFNWLHDYHISCFIGENKKYVKGRLKQLTVSGLIRRAQLKSQKPACNWITAEGLTLIGEKRNVHTPSLAKYSHDLGVADMCCLLTLPKFGKDKQDRILHLGDIITERDFYSVREMVAVGTKRDGTPIYKSADDGIHAPDAYYVRNGKYIALEFERVHKSTKDIVEENIKDLMKRFSQQMWFYENNRVRSTITEIAARLPKNTIRLFNIEDSRKLIRAYVESLPQAISKKSGIPRDSSLGEFLLPEPLNRIPYRSGIHLEDMTTNRKVELE